MSGAGAPALPLAEAVERLRAPDAFECWSPLTGEPVLVVDLTTESADEPGPARAALAALPCPTVGYAPELAPGAAAWAPRFDALVQEPSDLEALVARVRRAPLAAQALVQILRGSEQRDLESGLAVESFAYSALQAGPEFAAWLAARGAPRHAAESRADAPLRVQRDGPQLHLTLDRPARRNAWSAAMRDALVEALELALRDGSIREIVLDGAGPAFCGGGDLDEFGSLPDPATAHAIRLTRSPARLVAACAARLRAELHGACVGAGIELPAFAGRIVAREDAFFELPELGLGLVPGAGGTVSLPRRVGRQRTAWLALTGARLDARSALSWGLIDEIRPDKTD